MNVKYRRSMKDRSIAFVDRESMMVLNENGKIYDGRLHLRATCQQAWMQLLDRKD